MGGARSIVQILAALSLVTVLSPVAVADHGPSCSSVTAEAVALGDLYLRQTDQGAEVWQESNGLDGLQTHPCTGFNGRLQSADTFHAEAPGDTSALPGPGEVLATVEAVCNTVTRPLGARCFLT